MKFDNNIGQFFRILVFAGIIIFINCSIVNSELLFNKLTWNANSEPDLTEYRVYRSSTSGNYTKGNPFTTVPKGITSYQDNNIEADQTYFYVVTAVNSFSLESNFSNQVSISKSQEEQPVLSNGIVSPTSGSSSTTYVYTVHFLDPGGQAPAIAKVFIDDQGFTMSLYSGSSNDGVYSLSRSLGKGEHTFYFYFNDSSMNVVRFPLAGYLSGPTVSSSKPEKPSNVRYKNK